MADEPGSDPARADCFAPPAEPCECYCLHCQRVVDSGDMWYQRVVNSPDRDDTGFWMCPTPNCSGAGFTFDLFPTDPEHPGNAGWSYSDDEDEDDGADDADADADADYDPAGPTFADPAAADPTDDPEGEAEQRQYDEPDRRPRIVDGSSRPKPPPRPPGRDDDIPY